MMVIWKEKQLAVRIDPIQSILEKFMKKYEFWESSICEYGMTQNMHQIWTFFSSFNMQNRLPIYSAFQDQKPSPQSYIRAILIENLTKKNSVLFYSLPDSTKPISDVESPRNCYEK